MAPSSREEQLQLEWSFREEDVFRVEDMFADGGDCPSGTAPLPWKGRGWVESLRGGRRGPQYRVPTEKAGALVRLRLWKSQPAVAGGPNGLG